MSFLGGLAGEFASGAISNYWNSKASAQANDYNVYNYQNRYQWAVNDMKAAGLNPILAATNGINGSINGAVPLASSIGNDSISGMSNSATARRAQEQQGNLIASQVENTNANTALAKAQASSQDWKNNLFQKTFNQQVERAQLDVDLLRQQGRLQEAAVKEKTLYIDSLMPAMAVKMIAEASASNSAAGYHSALTQLTNVQRSISKIDREMKERLNASDKYIPVSGNKFELGARLAGRFASGLSSFLGNYNFNRSMD